MAAASFLATPAGPPRARGGSAAGPPGTGARPASRRVLPRSPPRSRIAWEPAEDASAEGTGFVVGLLIVGFVIVALALYGVDRAIKARAQVRRLRNMSGRLEAATVRADKQQERRQAAAQASAALTSVMPAIERPPLTLPGTASHDAATNPATSHGGARPKTGCEHTGPQELRAAHPGRRPSHVSKHLGVVRVKPDGDRGQSECDGAPRTG
jgi:hypothetical protein